MDCINSRLENKLIIEIEEFSNKLIKDLKRNNKIIRQSDKRQAREYEKLEKQYEEIKKLKKELEETQAEVVFIMGSVGESRSQETGNHVKRVAEYSFLLAKYYGLTDYESIMIKQASPMHDIGKIGIPDAILNKPARLTQDEMSIMQTHATLGYNILQHSTRPLLQMAATIAHTHHEKYDGTGYPQKLQGDAIPIYGRITALADVFDALGSHRIYKEVWSDEAIFKLLKQERGYHFDPDLIDIFFDNIDQFLAVRESLKDKF